MNILYLDCQSGISGDMTLSALIDLGADITYIRDQLKNLPIDSFTMNIKQVDKKGISAKQLDLRFDEDAIDLNDSQTHNHIHTEHQHLQVHSHEGHNHNHNHNHNHEGHNHSHNQNHTHTHSHVNTHELHDHSHDGHHHHHHEHRKASTILEMINKSELPESVKRRSSAVFEVIAEAEGKIHGMDPREVHFHEVGAMDSIIDVIGVCLALENLKIDKIISSPVPTGYGKVKMAHGLYPIPAPATAEILIGIPLADFQVKGELTTPTGAGFLKALASDYGQIPPLSIVKIGYGAGKKDFDHPNVLRAFLFRETPEAVRETIKVLECQLDDITGEALGYAMTKILAKGALDVFYSAVSMKKSRPGFLITVLAKPQDAYAIEELLLKETSTFGVRMTEWTRRILERKFEKVSTPYGDLTVKIGYEGDVVYKISPEFEEAKKAALKHDVPLLEVYAAVQAAARERI
jgi:pyridinium-3,5-bisthiocarboxylic acid mononucleotide nickel chelatase